MSMPVRIIERVLRAINDRQLAAIERRVQAQRGKGWRGTMQDEVRAFSNLLRAHPRRAPLTILDVGANRGSWTRSLLGLVPSCLVHAFEPSDEAFAELQALGTRDRRVIPHNIALGAHDSEAVLYADSPGSTLSSLSQRNLAHLDLTFDHAQRVVMRHLDGWAREHGLDEIDAMKIDVEGHELDVLRGGERVLESIAVVQFEFGGANIDTSTYFRDFWTFFQERGFSLLRLTPRGPVAIDSYSERSEVFLYTNMFAVRRKMF